jgi:anti-anti-sigma factor
MIDGGGGESAEPAVSLRVSRAATLDVELRGEIDFGNAPGVLDAVRASILRRRPALVRVDLELVTYFDSSAVRMLLKIVEAAEQAAAAVRVENPSPAVQRIFEIAGLSDHFGPFER